MNPGCKSEILATLRRHRGPEHAITAEAIGELLFGRKGLGRQVRAAIAELIEEHPYPILANTGGMGEAFPDCPPGYFWATSPAQIRAYYNTLVSRDEEIRHRMDRAWEALSWLEHEEPAQLVFELPGAGEEPAAAGQRTQRILAEVGR